MTVKTMLWDLDGTLTDPGLGITNSILYMLKKTGRQPKPRAELYKYIGPPLMESFQKYDGMTEAESREALDIYREYFGEIGLFENEVYPGIPDLLADLRTHGVRHLVATSKPEAYARRILDRFALSRYFDFIGGSDMAETRVKKSDVIACVLAASGADPASCLMVGDREHDVLGARANSIPCAGVLWGYGSRAELTAAGAAVIWESVKEVRGLLERRPGEEL